MKMNCFDIAMFVWEQNESLWWAKRDFEKARRREEGALAEYVAGEITMEEYESVRAYIRTLLARYSEIKNERNRFDRYTGQWAYHSGFTAIQKAMKRHYGIYAMRHKTDLCRWYMPASECMSWEKAL